MRNEIITTQSLDIANIGRSRSLEAFSWNSELYRSPPLVIMVHRDLASSSARLDSDVAVSTMVLCTRCRAGTWMMAGPNGKGNPRHFDSRVTRYIPVEK